MLNPYYVSSPVIGIGTTELNKSRQNLCPHGAYTLVYVPTVIIKYNNICETRMYCKTIYTYKVGVAEMQTS